MRTLKFMVLTAVFLTLTACGTKGPVRPIEVPLPGPVPALTLHQQGEALQLNWQLPTSNQDGSPLKTPPTLDIYRMIFDPQNDCPECFDRSTLLVSIDPELPEPALKSGSSYQYLDRKVSVGTGYQYKLVPRNTYDEAGQTIIVRQAVSLQIDAPQQFKATAHDRAVKLSWQPINLRAGDTLLGYQIYRRVAGETGAAYPRTAKPLQQTSYDEFNLENNLKYRYRVRALIKRDDRQIESKSSAEESVTPQTGS